MKVNNLPDSKVGLPMAASKRTTEGVGSPTGRAAAPVVKTESASVKISPLTQAMTNALTRADSDSFDAGKVQAMRMAIQNGSYTVNAEVIADKMLMNARELLGIAAGTDRKN